MPFNRNRHDSQTYSCWHKNESMRYRCWGNHRKILECLMALTKSMPEVDCELFMPEEIHPSEALVTKQELKERFYQPNGYCLVCQNCVD